MTTIFSKLLVALAGVGILSAAVSPTAGGEQISIASSRAVRPLVQQAVEEFGKDYPNLRFVVGSGRSDNAVASVGKDEVQIGLISRDLTDSEKATYRHLRPVRIAIDGVGLIVHPLNSVCDLSTEQVCNIFTGRITNWTEVGGTDTPIVLFSANRHHGTFDLFCEHFAMTANEQGDQIVFQEDEASDHATRDSPCCLRQSGSPGRGDDSTQRYCLRLARCYADHGLSWRAGEDTETRWRGAQRRKHRRRRRGATLVHTTSSPVAADQRPARAARSPISSTF